MVIIIHSKRRKLRINLARFLFTLALIACFVTGSVSIMGYEPTAMSAYEETESYTVTSGDTLWSIASQLNDGSYDTRKIVNDIRKCNTLSDPTLYVGQTIEIPGIYCS